ncbi:MAG: succinyl-diaminopimelate desuccinylase [Acidimicrobiales bacterium]
MCAHNQTPLRRRTSRQERSQRRSAHTWGGALNSPDLLQLTADLIDVPSESFEEAVLADLVEARLEQLDWLRVVRVGDNVVARTELGRKHRLLLGGHLDTVPANGNATARVDGDVLWGLGAADMKSGLAVMLTLAEALRAPAVDVTYLFYAREEVAFEHSGLRELFAHDPKLCEADLALLGEPTSGKVEAGCQGTMRFRIEIAGARAHTARPWMGRNSIHRLGSVLRILENYEAREPVIDGCTYREALQAVFVDGGVAGNVVPDMATVTVNHRVAPDRTLEQARDHIRELFAPELSDDDRLIFVDEAPPAPPGLFNPLLAALIGRYDLQVLAKLGWTDVSFFHQHGIPAANFGPGESTLAHTADERVERAAVEACYELLRRLLSDGL